MSDYDWSEYIDEGHEPDPPPQYDERDYVIADVMIQLGMTREHARKIHHAIVLMRDHCEAVAASTDDQQTAASFHDYDPEPADVCACVIALHKHRAKELALEDVEKAEQSLAAARSRLASDTAPPA